MVRAEKVIIEGKFLKNVFSENFLKIIEKLGDNIFPISVVLVKEIGDEKNKMAFPVVLSHQTNEEVEKGNLHIESPNTELVELIARLMEEAE